MKKILIAAPKSGSGKTLLTCALIENLKRRGIKVAAKKCGPDYIDPMFHRKVLGIPSGNLDTFFTDKNTTLSILNDTVDSDTFLVIEGVMGLFDGLGGTKAEGSSYQLAEYTNAGIILVVDARGAGYSLLAQIKGFLDFDRCGLIKGVILNKISKGFYETIKPLIEDELDIKVLGYLENIKDFSIESRHLGLKLPYEVDDLKNIIDRLYEISKDSIDIESIMDIANDENGALEDSEIDLYAEKKICKNDFEYVTGNTYDKSKKRPCVAVSKDEAFSFIYEENINMLQKYADVVFFSPLHDTEIPEDVDGLYLVGGYPENFLDELKENISIKDDIRSKIKMGMPIVAECGGFMYLTSGIYDEDILYDMCGVFDSKCKRKERLVRFGYIELSEKKPNFMDKGEIIKAHEFHYYDTSYNGIDCIAKKPTTGKEYDCIIDTDNIFAGFPHLYFPSNEKFVRKFVKKCENYREIQNCK